jgi:hypothetical protein
LFLVRHNWKRTLFAEVFRKRRTYKASWGGQVTRAIIDKIKVWCRVLTPAERAELLQELEKKGK